MPLQGQERAEDAEPCGMVITNDRCGHIATGSRMDSHALGLHDQVADRDNGLRINQHARALARATQRRNCTAALEDCRLNLDHRLGITCECRGGLCRAWGQQRR